MKHLLFSALLVALLTTGAHAEEEDAPERPRHHTGQTAATLSQAVSNLTNSNDHLSALLAKRDLSDADLEIIHQLTYTLENALARIDEEVATMMDLVEEVHQGSENGERERVRDNGKAYLEAIRPLVK